MTSPLLSAVMLAIALFGSATLLSSGISSSAVHHVTSRSMSAVHTALRTQHVSRSFQGHIPCQQFC